MSALVVFDFDDTLAHITPLHRLAWEYTLQDVGLSGDLATYLPPRAYAMERFDSAQRIRTYFFRSAIDRSALEFFFATTDIDKMTSYLLDLKESHLLHLLEQLPPAALRDTYMRNIFPGLDILLSQDAKIGIISSTRESIILQTLEANNLEDAFDFIIGEESLRDEHGVLQDKPRAYAKSKIPERILKKVVASYYIGDDVRIDSALARNCRFKYIQCDKKSDLLTLCKYIG